MSGWIIALVINAQQFPVPGVPFADYESCMRVVLAALAPAAGYYTCVPIWVLL